MELMLGCWLLISPFVLDHAPDRSLRWAHDLGVGSVVVGIALACHWRPLERAHLALLPLAAWLTGVGWWQAVRTDVPQPQPDAALQNWILVGLLLGMFALVPSEASRPPRPWRRRASGRAMPPEEHPDLRHRSPGR
jgi:hypothetical protein